jgi:hypothetical protein
MIEKKKIPYTLENDSFKVKLPKGLWLDVRARHGLHQELLLLECRNPLSHARVDYTPCGAFIGGAQMAIQLQHIFTSIHDGCACVDLCGVCGGVDECDCMDYENIDPTTFVDETVYREWLNKKNFFNLPLQMFPKLLGLFRVHCIEM